MYSVVLAPSSLVCPRSGFVFLSGALRSPVTICELHVSLQYITHTLSFSSYSLPKQNKTIGWIIFFGGGGSCSFTKNGRRNTWNGSTTTTVPSVIPSTRSAKGCPTLPLPSLLQIRWGIRRHRRRGAATATASTKGRRSTTSRGFRRNRNPAAPMPS